MDTQGETHIASWIKRPAIEEDKKADGDDPYIYETLKGSALMTVRERAQGIIYHDPLTTTWTIPRKFASLSAEILKKIRYELNIAASGISVPPPLPTFKDMKVPRVFREALKAKGIKAPTTVQMQALPCVLAGRDIIAVASTGSGKSLIFLLPLILMCIEEEKKLSMVAREGPLGLICLPSRELAKQVFEVAKFFCDYYLRSGGVKINIGYCVGGTDLRSTLPIYEPLHIVVGTPGRLSDVLTKKKFNLDMCKYFVLDEADRLLDLAFEEEIRNILDHFSAQRQTLLFSATMPKKIQEFAQSALVQPIIINIGRAGSASKNIKQEIEYVRDEEKRTALLTTLSKTSPPVMIFCEVKNDVEEIYEYLRIKGVQCRALHGGLDQEERTSAIDLFRASEIDVLIATDVMAKGLDIPNIKHVINYDMPREIENYVHRIGRTGRGGQKGRATTYVNQETNIQILRDLKSLLIEAEQEIPHFMAEVEDTSSLECEFCGGLGHTIEDCNKMINQKRKVLSNMNGSGAMIEGSRYGGGGAGYGGEV